MATLKEKVEQLRNGGVERNTSVFQNVPEGDMFVVPHDKKEAPTQTESKKILNAFKDYEKKNRVKNEDNMEALMKRWNYLRFLGSVAKSGILGASWLFWVACADTAIIALTIRFILWIFG